MTSPIEILSEDSLGQKRISFFSGKKLLECWIESENPSLRIGEIHYASRTRRGLLSVIWAICHFQEALGWLQEILGASNPGKVMNL